MDKIKYKMFSSATGEHTYYDDDKDPKYSQERNHFSEVLWNSTVTNYT